MQTKRLVLVGVAVVLCLTAAGALGYVIGSGSGQDLEEARAEGAAAGQERGTRAGQREGYDIGFRLGERHGKRRAYNEAYREAYESAIEEADLSPPVLRALAVSASS